MIGLLRFPVTAFVLGLLLLVATGDSVMGQAPKRMDTSPMLFGTLLTDTAHAEKEYAAGIRVVHLELSWRRYEPADGNFDAAYAEQMKEKLAAFRRAKMRVVLGTGLQYAPNWLYDLPNSKYINQDGVTVGPVNLTYNPILRGRAERFLRRVAWDMGTDFWAVRVGSGAFIECFYPGGTAGGTRNSYWAFYENAQKTCPFPGWKPGQREYRSQPFTTTQVEQWYDWYVGALVDGMDWQIASYRRLGYTGDIHVLMPGLGTRPLGYKDNLSRYLDGSKDGGFTMARGAVWFKVVEKIKDKRGCVVYVSSIADGSGRDDLPQTSDVKIALNDPSINTWSATRWLTYLADKYGMEKSGENPGRKDSRPAYALSMLQKAIAQARAGRFNSFLWAHDFNLYDGTGPTLDQFAEAIRQTSPR